jgi:hypothetical protein
MSTASAAAGAGLLTTPCRSVVRPVESTVGDLMAAQAVSSFLHFCATASLSVILGKVLCLFNLRALSSKWCRENAVLCAA